VLPSGLAEVYNSLLMEPRIQYAKTKDGVNIAFWTLGEGTPLVHLSFAFSHIQLEWQIPECRRWYERLAEKRTLVRMDPRGLGLSERDITELSADAWVLDVEAVVDRLGLEKFALLGPWHTGPVAIAYAARHPERVSRLILWGAYAWASEYLALTAIRAIRPIVGTAWQTYTEAVAHVLLGWSAGEPARRYAALVDDSVRPEFFEAVIIPVLSEFDVRPLLPEVRSPTLVLHRRQCALVSVDSARGLASGIPDARLVVLEGESGAPYLGDTEAVLSAINEFLGDSGPAPVQAEPVAAGGVCTILFTDVEGSTALTERLGDAKAREVLRTHERITREALRAHGGAEVKAMGDGFMASFSSATRALECAIAMQRAFAAHDDEHPETPIRVRIGLNAGEPIAEDEDLFGTAVILAARIAAHAEGGEILASDVVRQLVAGKGFLFADRGEVALRGFEDPVRLYEVQWHPTVSQL
jgi:class 3 adenylate cyclase/pimeloyl-ACP methyl ester carboxylesterase